VDVAKEREAQQGYPEQALKNMHMRRRDCLRCSETLHKAAQTFQTFWFGLATLANDKIKGKIGWSGVHSLVSFFPNNVFRY